MKSTKTPSVSDKKKKSRPAVTPEARENRLISKAYDLVEQRLDDGTATSQETTTLLKLGTMKARLEIEKLKKENQVLKAKAISLESSTTSEELYRNAIEAFKIYSGKGDDEDYRE